MKKAQPMEKPAHCSNHGAYTSKWMKIGPAEIWTKCQKCYDEQELKKKSEIKNNISWLSKRRSNMTLNTYKCDSKEQSVIYNRCIKYVDNFEKVKTDGCCLCMLGNPGTGKTHLATAIGVAVINKNYSVSYEKSYDLMNRIKNTYNKSVKTTEEEIMKQLVVFDLLILDEIGLKELSETDRALIYQIIDKRYEEVKPTIVISNLSEKELSTNIGARTVDRMYENKGVVFIFDWESNRRS